MEVERRLKIVNDRRRTESELRLLRLYVHLLQTHTIPMLERFIESKSDWLAEKRADVAAARDEALGWERQLGMEESRCTLAFE